MEVGCRGVESVAWEGGPGNWKGAHGGGRNLGSAEELSGGGVVPGEGPSIGVVLG